MAATLVKFYADTPKGEKNKLFKWRTFGHNGVRTCLMYWMKKGFYIRAAWACDWSKGIQSNHRQIDLSSYSQYNISKTA